MKYILGSLLSQMNFDVWEMLVLNIDHVQKDCWIFAILDCQQGRYCLQSWNVCKTSGTAQGISFKG